jgi:hypothetical protein
MADRRKTMKTDDTQRERRGAADHVEASGARLEDRTRTELFELAHRLDIAGYADMSKSELVEAIRRR